MAKEKNFENRIKSFLKEKDCWFVKYWGGGEFTKAGVPDILCCCCGCFIGIEVKGEHGRPSELQLHNLKKIDETGGFAILLYPKDFETFKDFIYCLQANDSNFYVHYEHLKGVWSDE